LKSARAVLQVRQRLRLASVQPEHVDLRTLRFGACAQVVCPRVCPRVAIRKKSSRDPSGLQQGAFAFEPSAVRRLGVELPFVETNQMELFLGLLFWSMAVTT
jgi:hypothetical protein